MESEMVVLDHIVELGFDAGVKQFESKINDDKLKTSLAQYISTQKKYNEICSLGEEIDFQGLTDFIKQKFLPSVDIRLFSPSKKARGNARRTLIEAAISYSSATTDGSRKRVIKYVDDCLDILRTFYTQNISKKEYLIAADIVDAIDEQNQKATADIKDALKEQEARLSLKMSSPKSIFSLDSAVQAVREGVPEKVGVSIENVLKHVSVEHPYYPDFGYDYFNGQLISKPLNRVAQNNYPSRYKIFGTLHLDNPTEKIPSNTDPFDYAYRHQLQLVMDVKQAIKYLGQRIDPLQTTAKLIEGDHLRIIPSEFPEAFPCSVKLDDSVYYDYILFRTQEILDDGTYIISNKEQLSSITIEIHFNFDFPQKNSFNISIRDGSNTDLLQYIKFIRALDQGGVIHIFVLPLKQDILSGRAENIKYQSSFDSIDNEIKFLEGICCIEKYFGVNLYPDGDILYEDFLYTLDLSELIQKNEIKKRWEHASISVPLDSTAREMLLSLDGHPMTYSYICREKRKLFGADIEYVFRRTHQCATVLNVEKLHKKAEIMDDGEIICIQLQAEDDKITIDRLLPQDQIGENAHKNSSTITL